MNRKLYIALMATLLSVTASSAISWAPYEYHEHYYYHHHDHYYHDDSDSLAAGLLIGAFAGAAIASTSYENRYYSQPACYREKAWSRRFCDSNGCYVKTAWRKVCY